MYIFLHSYHKALIIFVEIIFKAHQNIIHLLFFRFPMSKLLVSSLTAAALLLPTTLVHANGALDYNVVSLQAEANRTVANDEMHVRLYLEKSHKQPALLATEVNQLINQALATARQYPSVKVETGSQSTSPIYDDSNRKLKEWRTNAQIYLQSTDFKATAQLIAALQQHFQTDSVSFSVSQAKRSQVENDLMVEASKNFQQRAKTLAQAWNKSSYQMVSINVDNSSYTDHMAGSAMASAVEKTASYEIPQQHIEAGDSQLTVRLNGSVQLK